MRTNPSRWRASRRGLEVAVDASSLSVVVFVENMIWCRSEAQSRKELGTVLFACGSQRTISAASPNHIGVDPQH